VVLPTTVDPVDTVPGWQRGLLIATGCVLLGLLVTAARLEPDPRGLGTHQRLGLPPCTFYSLTGLRCPSCGMTTSWAYLTRGRLLAAVQANLGGALAGLVAAVVGPWMLCSGVRGRWVVRAPDANWSLVIAGFLLVATIADWVYRLTGG
jgi:hypothetical protein